MNPENDIQENDGMRSEYDFSGGIQGKHYQKYQKGKNVVFLEPDIAKVFKDSAAVNRALRLLLDLAKEQTSTNQLNLTNKDRLCEP